MTHHVCKGTCGAKADAPGTCGAGDCSHTGKAMVECNCSDDMHAEGADSASSPQAVTDTDKGSDSGSTEAKGDNNSGEQTS